MTVIISRKDGPNGSLLIITDEDLLGKIFEEGKVRLDMTKKFYQGRTATKEEARELLTMARDIHLTGKEAVALGLEANLVDPDKIIYVQKIPHAQVAIG